VVVRPARNGRQLATTTTGVTLTVLLDEIVQPHPDRLGWGWAGIRLEIPRGGGGCAWHCAQSVSARTFVCKVGARQLPEREARTRV
jgi:hypothetical protein